MIAKKAQYPGQCLLCKQIIDKAQMKRHLKKCLTGHDEGTGKSVELFHLVIEGEYLPEYWLHIEIPGAKTLQHLDSFLRNIWLECCGHLSCFTIGGQRYSVYPAEGSLYGPREKTMKQKIYKVLSAGARFQHEYDYGSTTELKLRVVDVRERRVKKPEVLVLARNEPPSWVCAECEKPATQIRDAGWGFDADSLFCDDCLGDDEDEGCLPVVNSPRVGVCGYCG